MFFRPILSPKTPKIGTKIIGIADLWIYKESKTCIYKYNFIDTINANDSSIDSTNNYFHKNSSEYQLNIILENFI